MRIESSQQMFQHIENGGNLKLNKEGQLESQSAVGRFSRKSAMPSVPSPHRAVPPLKRAMRDCTRLWPIWCDGMLWSIPPKRTFNPP